MFSQTKTITAATREDKMKYLPLTRRTVLKTAALGSVAAITAPYVRGSYAAGKLTLGCWDHWVPHANDTLTNLCNEWGEKNKVEVRIDYITSQGEKDKLTAAAEAQAGTGHDIMSHRRLEHSAASAGARAGRRCR
jgi:ABC-type glycerol-3-phosphate transport system substrate-binding protein